MVGSCDPRNPCDDCRRRNLADAQRAGLAKAGDVRRVTNGPFKGRVYVRTASGQWTRLWDSATGERRAVLKEGQETPMGNTEVA